MTEQTYNEEHGPDLGDDHRINYEVLDLYSYTDEVSSSDYFKVGEIDGVVYYSPNDENWGPIIAIHHESRLACDTHFYEMDDMEAEDSDYKMVVTTDKLLPAFEID